MTTQTKRPTFHDDIVAAIDAAVGRAKFTKRAARDIVGGLSDPSKMPGFSIGLPARQTCPVGNKLAEIPGTPCFACYADDRGMYQFPVVKEAQARRLARIRQALSSPDARAAWVAAMVTLIGKQEFFRWHDSGDIFSADYLALIIDVVVATPNVQHWLPTQERGTVRAWMRVNGAFPENLTVRVSMPLIDAAPEMIAATNRALGLPVSSVQMDGASCPARFQGNECGKCRKCWDATVLHVSYPKH